MSGGTSPGGFVTLTNSDATAALYAALHRAIKETRSVGKHGQGQGYLYARAEDVMREADRVLNEHGIVVAPIGSAITVAGTADSKNGPKPIFVLTCRFLVAHEGGGSFVGEQSLAVGTNLAATPPQATSSAYTCCERDFYRALLRMPRGPDDDVESPKNNRPAREEEPSAPARPAVAPPAARKATRVLAAIAAAKDAATWDKCRERWDAVLAERTAEDDCGYTDAEVGEIKAALAKAAERLGL